MKAITLADITPQKAQASEIVRRLGMKLMVLDFYRATDEKNMGAILASLETASIEAKS